MWRSINSTILVLLMIFMLAACSNKQDTPSPSKNTPMQSEPAKTTPPPQQESPKNVPPNPQPKPSPQPKSSTKTIPKKQTKETKPKSKQIGYYETALHEAGNPRITNLKLAMKKINGKIINPNEEFSFNKEVGSRTEIKGYKEAKIYKNKEEVEEVGGGICQLSSTLFCAARNAGLKITERHEHQLPVEYAKKGDDATVYYGSLDLKFINTCNVPIKISCSIKDRKVKVSINTVIP